MEGDLKIFEDNFDLHYTGMVKFAYQRTGDIFAAKDIVAEVFVRYWNKMTAKGQKIEDVRGYLYTSVYYDCKKYNTRRKITRDQVDEYVQSTPNAEMPGSVSESDNMELVKNEIARQPPITQQVVTLFYYENLSLKEIAEYLKIPISTIKSLKFRFIQDASRKLQKC